MTEHFPAGLPTPRPELDPQTMPFWEAAQREELVLPHCADCEQFFWYPRGFCPRCGGTRVDWKPSAGSGEIYSFSVVRRAGGVWAEHVPFVLAYIALDEGVTVQANIVDCSTEQLVPGHRVKAVFERDNAEDLPILRFTPEVEEQ